jgi:hypothetical protein
MCMEIFAIVCSAAGYKIYLIILLVKISVIFSSKRAVKVIVNLRTLKSAYAVYNIQYR